MADEAPAAPPAEAPAAPPQEVPAPDAAAAPAPTETPAAAPPAEGAPPAPADGAPPAEGAPAVEGAPPVDGAPPAEGETPVEPPPKEPTPEPEPPKMIDPANITEIKLIYFNVKALGEPLRFLLAYSGVEWKDVRVTRFSWPKVKPTVPFGILPCLEVDGVRVSQTQSIARFLARQAGLMGQDCWEDMLIDIAVETVNDFRLKISLLSYEQNDDAKEKKLQTLNEEVIPFYLEKLDHIAKDNGGFLAIGKMTWADVYFTGILDYLNYLTKCDLVEHRVHLKKIVTAVRDNENIKAWIEKRPLTDC